MRPFLCLLVLLLPSALWAGPPSIVIVAEDYGTLSFEALLGLEATEILRLDAADPARAQALDAAVAALPVRAVLLVETDENQALLAVRKLAEGAPRFWSAMQSGEVAVSQLRVDRATGRFALRQIPLTRIRPGEALSQVPAEPAATEDPAPAILEALLPRGAAGQIEAAGVMLDAAILEQAAASVMAAPMAGPATGQPAADGTGPSWGRVKFTLACLLLAGGIMLYTQRQRLMPAIEQARLNRQLQREQALARELRETQEQNPALREALHRLRDGLRDLLRAAAPAA